MKRYIISMLVFGLLVGTVAIAQSKKSAKKSAPISSAKDTTAAIVKPMVTFIELGSVNCIPCKAMQPVMKSVAEKYGTQIKIIFYDVWKQEQAGYAKQYNIRLIPTQLFLDANGKELMRHEGFFPEKAIDTFLQSKGLKPKANGKG
jgi:thioredoxin 1